MINRLVITSIAFASISIGWYVTYLKLDSAKLERDAQIERAVTAESRLLVMIKDQKKTEELLKTYQQKQAEIVYVDKTVTRDIIKYRDRVVNRCDLSAEWVRIIDAATAMSGEDTSGSANGSSESPGADGVDDARALEVVTNNYRLCVRQAEQLKALQDWVLLGQKKGPE